MLFDVAATAYDAFMGRWSRLLSRAFVDFSGVLDGQRVLDVGAGTGALTAELVDRLGAGNVVAVDPSEPFVAALRVRFPPVEVRAAAAGTLPFADGTFDACLAQLVVHFMPDPVAGILDMARVTKPDGVVAASVWDYGGKRDPLRQYWSAAKAVDPDVVDESHLPGTNAGDLITLFHKAHLGAIESTVLTVELEFGSFQEWWAPFEAGVGPAGVHFAGLRAEQQAGLRQVVHAELGDGPFVMAASAWAARGLSTTY